jgi:hypothetical protein
MIFSFRKVDSLPRLAWCAIVTRQDQAVVVYHGPDVELASNAFFEGAWDGEFRQFDFDEARVFAGSGARLRHDKVVFSTDTGVFDWLYTVQVGARMFVSNSIAFLFSITCDKPDPAYPFYYADLIHYARMGQKRRNRSLRAASGRQIKIFWTCNLHLDHSLQIEQRPKQVFAEPSTFTQYVDMLTCSFSRVACNAADTGRKLQFTPLSALSRGYDCNASAAIVASLGYRDGFTFQNLVDEDFGRSCPDDSGLEVGKQLDMHVIAVSPTAYRRLQVPRDDEFCANPAGSEVLVAGLESDLQGRLLVGGRIGDYLWKTGKRLPSSEAVRPELTWVPGLSINDFRLRVGFLRVDLPQIGANCAQAIQRISRSEEMRAWRLGGDYDRPIPRRLLEQHGVRRDMFGMKKMSGGFVYLPFNVEALSPQARVDFDQFYSGIKTVIPTSMLERLRRYGPVLCYQIFAAFSMPGIINTLVALKSTLSVGRRVLLKRVTPGLYTFHWGIERLRERYTVPDEGDG